MQINKIYSYPQLSRESIDGTRYYNVYDANVPSVTSILDKTSDKTFLETWKKRIGEEQAEKEVRYAANVGSLMHDHLEKHIQNIDRKKSSNMIHKLAYNMADIIIDKGLCNVDEVYGIEESLHYDDLWAGATDLIASYNKKLSICDYKNSKKIKKEEHLENYKCQLVAYAMAHNNMFGTNINQGVIFMCARDLSYKTFILEGSEFEKYKYKWAKRVETYYK